jgi:putative aldouronate transport system permease protein
VILIKTYIESIPSSIEESALIDGAGHFRIFIQMILPLSKPILAAIAVFAAVAQWNEWFSNFMLVTNPRLNTLQLILMRYLREAETIAQAVDRSPGLLEGLSGRTLSSFTIRTTISVMTIIPILVVYPIMQKYFVKGIMIGSVKG